MATENALQRVLHDPVVVRLAKTFVGAGHQLYLVGGSVRDALLGVEHSDLDFTTDARPDAIEKLVRPQASAVWTVGRAFGTIGARCGDHTVEITTFRSDVYLRESRKPEVSFGDSIADDLMRRDFTVNAMAISLPDGKLVDPAGGLRDLAGKRLATPRSAKESFDEDPLRIMRAARFTGQIGLRPSVEVRRAMESMHDRLGIVSVERIRDEFSKTLLLDDVTTPLWLLVDTGTLDEFAPEISAMRVAQDPVHRHKDVLTHTIAVTQKTRPELVVRLAALFHDVGKPATRSISPQGVQFHHHDAVGAKMARRRLRALRYPTDVIDAVTRLVFLHLRVHTYKMGWTDSAVRRYVKDAGPLLDELNELIRSDCTTRNKQRAAELQRRMDELEERIEELHEEEELAKLRPALDGRAVMDLLGIPPGPDVGRALDFLMHMRLEEGEIEPDEAGRRLLDWWSVHAPG